MPDDQAMLIKLYLTNTRASMDMDILEEGVTATKNKRSEKGSIEYGIHYGSSTKSPDIKFGVSGQ